MIFSSLSYLVFLPIVFAVYWTASEKFKKPILLVASYVFYMSWLPVYGFLLFSLSIVNYFLGLLIERNRKSQFLLYVSLALNIGALFYYKYTNFFLNSVFESLKSTFGLIGVALPMASSPMMDIILPLGISFFAFEFIHYTVDVRRGGDAIKKPLDFFLFASFFPSQISGPIKRYQDFDKQLNSPRKLQRTDIMEGLASILKGLFKKVALADNLAIVTGYGVNHVSSLGTADAWIVVTSFLLQIYYDFSGYTDMGIGSARLLGFHLPNNFNLPYVMSKNMIEFWQRWHMSLSSWLRDYISMPISGFRASKTRFNVSTLITMGACGLWHGAAWHYVMWGLLNGVALVLTREYQQQIKKYAFLKKIHSHAWAVPVAVLGTMFTRHLIGPFFLAKSVPDALAILGSMFWYQPSNDLYLQLVHSPFLVAFAIYTAYGLIFVPVEWMPLPKLEPIKNFLMRTDARRAALYVCGFAAALAFCPNVTSPFIYFQF